MSERQDITDPPSQRDTSVETARLENEKLRLEIGDLQRPVYARPTFWISVATAVVALAGVIGQNILSNIRKERADLDVVKATDAAANAEQRLEVAQADEKMAQAALKVGEQQLSAAYKRVEQIRLVRDAEQQKLDSTRIALFDLKKQLDAARAGKPDAFLDAASRSLELALQALPVTPRATATIAAWNIQGFIEIPPERIRRLADGLADLDSDVIVLTEVNPPEVTDRLASALADQGVCFRSIVIPQTASQNIGILYRCGTQLAISNPMLIAESNLGHPSLRHALAAEMNTRRTVIPQGVDDVAADPDIQHLVNAKMLKVDFRDIVCWRVLQGVHVAEDEADLFSRVEVLDTQAEQGGIWTR